MGKILLGLVVVIGVLGVIVGLSLLFAIPTLLIVNYLFTKALILSVFGTPQLTFWKAFWLNFLCASLFKSNTTVNTKKVG